MTRKDYVLIAEALKEALTNSSEDRAYGVESAAQFVADALQQENPKFDRGRFLAAVGVQT